jgi:hypothetical protein
MMILYQGVLPDLIESVKACPKIKASSATRMLFESRTWPREIFPGLYISGYVVSGLRLFPQSSRYTVVVEEEEHYLYIDWPKGRYLFLLRDEAQCI